jgi:hypothetical protein
VGPTARELAVDLAMSADGERPRRYRGVDELPRTPGCRSGTTAEV